MNQGKLRELRKQIDELDAKIIRALGERFSVVHEVRKQKKAAGLPARDDKRWQEVLDSRLALAKEAELPLEFTEQLMNLIHERSLEIENS